MSSTGVDTWANPGDIGVLWPFAGGIATALVAISIAAWIIWHVVQVRAENREYEDAVNLYGEIGLERVMHPDGLTRVEQAMERMNHNDGG